MIENDPIQPNRAEERALDRLLATANWPDDPAGRRRLRDAYLAMRPRRRIRLWALSGAMAAAALVALMLRPAAPPTEPSHVKYMVSTGHANPTVGWESRPATPAERLVLMQSIRESVRSEPPPSVRQAPKASTDPTEPAESLIAQLRAPLVDQRMSAARELGAMGSAQVVARLAELAQKDATRREALAALLYCDDPAAAAALARLAESNSAIGAQVRALRLSLRS